MGYSIADRTDNGYSWTLTTYALKYLLEAEQLYGGRTNDFIYGGLELNESGPSHVWYPYSKYVVIQVCKSTTTNLKQAIFQIAYEVIHVLSPNGQPTTNNLEEGLATYFSKLVTDRDSGDNSYANTSIRTSKYLKPFEMVEKLLKIDPDGIKKLRKFQPIIGYVSKKNFVDAGISVSDELIDELLKPMDY